MSYDSLQVTTTGPIYADWMTEQDKRDIDEMAKCFVKSIRAFEIFEQPNPFNVVCNTCDGPVEWLDDKLYCPNCDKFCVYG